MSSTAQWDRIGTVAVGATVRFPNEPGKVRRSGLLLYNFWLKKLPHHKWPSQLTHSLAELFCEKISKNFSKILLKILSKMLSKILLKTTLLYSKLESLFIFYKR